MSLKMGTTTSVCQFGGTVPNQHMPSQRHVNQYSMITSKVFGNSGTLSPRSCLTTSLSSFPMMDEELPPAFPNSAFSTQESGTESMLQVFLQPTKCILSWSEQHPSWTIQCVRRAWHSPPQSLNILPELLQGHLSWSIVSLNSSHTQVFVSATARARLHLACQYCSFKNKKTKKNNQNKKLWNKCLPYFNSLG